MSKHKSGLGRGLGALIPRDAQQPGGEGQPHPPGERLPVQVATTPRTAEAVAASEPGPLIVPVESIASNPRQPRVRFPDEGLEELAESLRVHGLLQPLLVSGGGSPGEYTLVAGERRLRAAILAGFRRVPVVLREASSQEMLELALVENVQRADLNPLEEAQAYSALVEEFGLTQEQVAERVGKSRGAVANSLRLLRLPPVVLDALLTGDITEGHARALLQIQDPAQQERALDQIVAHDLSVRQVEALARRLSEGAGAGASGKPAAEKPLFSEVQALEDRFRNALGTKVQLSRSRRGGKLVIYFYSDEELDRIYGTIVGEGED